MLHHYLGRSDGHAGTILPEFEEGYGNDKVMPVLMRIRDLEAAYRCISSFEIADNAA